MSVKWTHGHEGALYGERTSMRYEVYPPDVPSGMWVWYAVDSLSNNVYASGTANTQELAVAAAEEHV